MAWFRRRERATGETHAIDVTADGVTIDNTPFPTLTVSALTAVLGEPRVLVPEDLTPNEYGFLPSTMVIWDDAGVRVYTHGGDEASTLSIRLADDPDWFQSLKPDVHAMHPTGVFAGTLTVGGQKPLDAFPEADLRKATLFLETAVGQWVSHFSLNETECGEIRAMEFNDYFAKSDTDELANIVRGAAHPFREVSVWNRPPKVVKKPSGKWKLPEATEPVLEIKSFTFRLAIIQELMYEQELLTPRFDVHDFAKDQGARSFDPFELEYEPIPSVRTWFRKFPIPARLAEHVETLVFDGGNEIYGQVFPQWDGEDDIFYVKSLTDADLAPFTRLRSVHDNGLFVSARVRAKLVERGITVTT